MEFSQNYRTNLFVNLFLVYIIWGSTYLGVKVGLKDFSPMLLTALRFFCGGLILLLFSLLRGKRASLTEIKGSALIGAILTGLGTTAVAYAILYIPSGLVALLVAMLPLWVFLLDFFFFSRVKPSWLSITGIFTGLIGVLFLFNPFALTQEQALPFWPFLVVMFGSISWAFGSIISPRVKQAKGVQGTAIQMLAGGLIAALFSLMLENNQWNSILHARGTSFGAMAYLIFVGSFVGYSAYVWLINHAPPLLTSSYAFVNPLVAIILGYFWVHEELSVSMLLASAVILVGVILMTLGRRRKNYEE